MTWIVTTLVGLALFVLFAWVARRLLGVRRLSTTRTVLAALGGLLLGELLAVVLWRQGLDRDSALLAGIVLGLVFTMIFIVGFEAMANPAKSKRRSSGLTNPVDATRRQVASGRRTLEIGQIASRNNLGKGFGLAVGGTMTPEEATLYGRDLAAAFEEAGGLFVKLGQLLATRPDLIPPETANELSKLHQDVAPVPREEIEPFLEAGMGASVNAVFSEFDWDPIGSGSLGQAYHGRLLSGEPVVVKVRRPDVEEVVARDLDLVLDLVRIAEQRSDGASTLGISEIADQFAAQLKTEMDYSIEGRSTVEVGLELENTHLLSVPAVYDLQMPPNVTEMMRAIVTLQGTLELLSPGYPIIDSARSLASDAFVAEMTPENLMEQVKLETIRVAPVLRRFPHHVDRIAGLIEQGNLSVRLSALSNEQDVRVLTRLVNRAILAFIGAALGVVSVMLLQVSSDFPLTDNIGLLDVLAFVGLFSGAILILRVVLETQQDR